MPAALIRSRIYYDEPGRGRLLLTPLAFAKRAFDAVFHWLVDRLWGELMGREQRSEVEHLGAFAVFVVFSMFLYRVGDSLEAVLLVFIAVWAADKLLARRAVAAGEHHRETSLAESEAGGLEWRREGAPAPLRLAPSDLRRVLVSRVSLRGGAFNEDAGTAWRVLLGLATGEELPVHEHPTPAEALSTARALAARLKIPVKVAGSVGQGELAESLPQDGAAQAGPESQGRAVSARWSTGGRLLFLRHVVEEAGFFLFLICVSRVLAGFGALFTGFLGPMLGWEEEVEIVIDLTLSGLWALFDPTTNWLDFGEFGAALAFLLYSGWRLGRSKSVEFGQTSTVFHLGGEIAGSLATARLESPVLVCGPEPVILLTDGLGVIEIADLHTEEAFVEFMRALEARIPAARSGR